jgi:hypothetical protein
MPDQFLDLVRIAGITFLITLLWGVTVAVTYWDIHRRGLSGGRIFLWLALVVLLPFIGFIVFLFFRILAHIFSPGTGGVDLKTRRETALKQPPAKRSPLPTFYATDFTKETVVNPKQISQPIAERQVTKKIVLTIFSGADKGKEFIVENLPAKIGRGSEVSICLDEDMGVSRKHAEIYESNGNLRIRDLNSTHGTQVNGICIEDKSLEPGDRLQIGMTVLVVREMEER